MSHGKDPSPLFEIIHKSARSSRRGVKVPDWMRRAEEMEERVGAAEPTVAAGKGSPPAILAWWSRPVRFRLQVGMVLLLGLAVVIAVVVAMFVGMEVQHRKSLGLAENYAAQYQKDIEPAQEKDPNFGLIPGNITRSSPLPDGVKPPKGYAGASGNAEDPRQPGLNYFRLTALPGSGKDEGQRAVEFLRENGIDAGLIPVNNGRSWKLLALRGFDRIGSPEAKGHAEQLRKLGRLWKAQHKGSSDWNDAIFEKYVPGRT